MTLKAPKPQDSGLPAVRQSQITGARAFVMPAVGSPRYNRTVLVVVVLRPRPFSPVGWYMLGRKRFESERQSASGALVLGNRETAEDEERRRGRFD
jgi:hypothetical protein